MKSQVVLFNGGLQTLSSPHLAQPNQAINCINVDLDKGSIFPLDGYDKASTVSGLYTTTFNGAVVSNTDKTDTRSYANLGNRLYWSSGDYGTVGLYRLKPDGVTVVDAVPPSVTTYGSISLKDNASNTPIAKTYFYAYTVVDEDGIESLPSPSVEIEIGEGDVDITIDLSVSSEVVTGGTVTFRRIYRTGGANPTYNLIAEIEANKLTYDDKTRDIDVSRIELTSFDSYPPPLKLTNLVSLNGTMWGSVGNRVYFSAQGRPEFWYPLDFFDLDEECIGLGKYRDSIIAFTENRTYVARGTNRDNLILDKLPYNEGCVSHWNITNITEALVWTSRNGVCMYDGSSVQVISRNILSWASEGIISDATFDKYNPTETKWNDNSGYYVEFASGYRGKYYAVYRGGIGVVDIFKGAIASTKSLAGVESVYVDNQTNTVTFIDTNLDTFKSEAIPSVKVESLTNPMAIWKTPKLTEGAEPKLKQYRRVLVSGLAEKIEVTIDDRLFTTVYNTDDFYLPSGGIGQTIQFTIYTLREIKSIQYEFGVLGAG